MKAKYLLYTLLAAYITVSCINDLGNYEYTSPEELLPVTISGYGDTTAVIGSDLVIHPVLNNLDDENRYIYLWWAAHSQTAGFAPQRDTLAQTRDLSVTIRMEAGTYNLVFEVRDPKLDIYVRKQVLLTVSASDITTGWYVLKDINDETDFDYISADETIIPDVLRNLAARQDIVNGPVTVGGQQLQGKAVKIVRQGTRYYHQVTNADGTVTTLANQRALHILSDRDFKTFNSDNIYLFKEFEDGFYEAPQERKPQNILFFSTDLYAINAGKLYSIYGMSANVGKFSFPKISETSPDYKLHNGMLASLFGALVFDTESRSFFVATSSGSTLNTFSPSNNPDLPSLVNMDYDLISILSKETSSATQSGYALFQNRTNGKYYIGLISTMGQATYPIVHFREVPAGAKMPDAQVLATPQVASCIYFATGNVLNYYIDATDLELSEREKVIKTFPADETISYISNAKGSHLAVLTNSANGWKLYGFPIVGVTPDINPEPEFVYSGTGNARYLMYRAS